MQRRHRAFRVLAAAACLQPALGSAAAPAEAPPLSSAAQVAADPIDALLDTLRAMPGLSASFTERKSIALLAVPLVNHGTIHYDPPGRLLRKVTQPHASSVLLLDHAIWIQQDGTAEQIDLAAYPAARSFVGSFRSLLAGNRAELDKHFELRLQRSEDDAWVLELRPDTDAMAKIVTKMVISGRGGLVERLLIEEASGDTSDTQFTNVDIQRKYTAQEAAVLFRKPE